MSAWTEAHEKSEILAAEAHAANRIGNKGEAVKLYSLAAAAEASALRLIPEDKPKTFGVTAVSAAALYYKADEMDSAEQIAMFALAAKGLPEFARHQLKTTIQTIWSVQSFRASGIEFARA